MDLRKVYIKSIFLSLLFFLFALSKFYFQVEYTKFFYLSYIVFFLVLVVIFSNIYSIFKLLGKADRPFDFVPVLIFHIVLIIICEFIIFSGFYSFDRFFIFYGFTSFLLYFLFFIFWNQKLETIWTNLKVLISIPIKRKLFKPKGRKEANNIKLKDINSNKLKLKKEVYLFILLFLVSIIIFFPILQIFKKISILWLCTYASATGFSFGVIYSFFDKKWDYYKLSYYKVIKLCFIEYLVTGIVLIIFYLFMLPKLPINLIEHFFILTISWYHVFLIICCPFFFLLGANIKYLLFDKFDKKR